MSAIGLGGGIALVALALVGCGGDAGGGTSARTGVPRASSPETEVRDHVRRLTTVFRDHAGLTLVADSGDMAFVAMAPKDRQAAARRLGYFDVFVLRTERPEEILRTIFLAGAGSQNGTRVVPDATPDHEGLRWGRRDRPDGRRDWYASKSYGPRVVVEWEAPAGRATDATWRRLDELVRKAAAG